MFDFIIENMAKLFVKDYSKDEYFMRNLITPDKGEFSQEYPFNLNESNEKEE